MGDFLLDIRKASSRRRGVQSSAFCFSQSLQVVDVDVGGYRLKLSHSAPDDLWSPFRSVDGSLFAVAGMCALSDSDWRRGELKPGRGGVAARALCSLYESDGLAALENVSGNCAVIVYDSATQQIHLVVDPAGAFPAFECASSGGMIFGSHPDILAQTAGEEGRWDEVSLAEFAVSRTVTPPFTYYENIKAVTPGTSLSLDIRNEKWRRHRYYRLDYNGNQTPKEEELADGLAGALKDAIRRRTFARFGTPVIALSGGADSRLLLAAMEDPSRALAFTCFDRANAELKTAETIASSVGAKFLPLQRSFDYYAENAVDGVRIGGGDGNICQ